MTTTTLTTTDHTMVCPECGEPAQEVAPTALAPAGWPRPRWSHRDGELLCPVMSRKGYRPALPVPATSQGIEHGVEGALALDSYRGNTVTPTVAPEPAVDWQLVSAVVSLSLSGTPLTGELLARARASIGTRLYR